MTLLRNIALLSAPYAVLTYRLPDALPEACWLPGQRVLAPVGRSLRVGVLLGPAQSCPEGVTLKDLLWPAEITPLLDEAYLDLARELSRRHMVPLGRILGSILPRGLKLSTFRFRIEGDGAPKNLAPKAIVRMQPEELRALSLCWREGRVRVVRDLAAEAKAMVCVLAKDPPWPVRPAAKKQLEILDHLYDSGPTPRDMIIKNFGTGAAQVLARLMDKGLVAARRQGADEEDEAPPAAEATGFDLTPEQTAALGSLVPALEGGGSRLLHGVTGSGKTAVYLELAKACLALGRSAVLLAPEVALALHLKAAAERYFGRPVILFHGYQSPARREAVFREVAEASSPVLVIGTRSALFLPLKRLGLIVLDEEHDSSFKQDERFLYQAKEVAFYLATSTESLLLLGSATPDIKTYHAAETGMVPCVRLSKRVGESVLPTVRIVNLMEETHKDAPLAMDTSARLVETVKAGDQAIIMLNRRGYSPLMYCLDCGETVKCPNCQVALTYHKSRERLVCHYCGLMRHFPLVCPKCGGSDFLPLGLGSEQLEERLARLLPETSIIRLDRDSARRQERLEEILRNFAAGKAQVMVGTQMLSKGHHFPNVTLVVVADGDMGLSMPDYRASERTFQLLVQVSGRAGRGDKPGEVIIQTRNPGHPFWQYVRAGDYEGFYARELEQRRKFHYPPFVKLALVRLSYPVDWPDGARAMSEAAEILRKSASDMGILVLGPAPSPLSQLKGRRRYQCLVKGRDWPSIRALYGRLEQAMPSSSRLHASLDLDPLDML